MTPRGPVCSDSPISEHPSGSFLTFARHSRSVLHSTGLTGLGPFVRIRKYKRYRISTDRRTIQCIYFTLSRISGSNVKVFTSRRDRRLASAGLATFGIGIVSFYLAVRTYFPLLFDPEKLRAVVQDFGLIAPLVYVIAHAVQVVLMAIPGYAMAVVGGILFGPFFGTVYTMIGVTVGSAIAFLIARSYGRPIVERMIREDALDRFDTFTEKAGLPGLFLFVLVPVLPEDVISFVAGLSEFRLSVFVVIMFFGRLPAAAVAVLAGDGIAARQFLEAGIWASSLVLASVYTYYYRDAIFERIGGT